MSLTVSYHSKETGGQSESPEFRAQSHGEGFKGFGIGEVHIDGL